MMSDEQENEPKNSISAAIEAAEIVRDPLDGLIDETNRAADVPAKINLRGVRYTASGFVLTHQRRFSLPSPTELSSPTLVYTVVFSQIDTQIFSRWQFLIGRVATIGRPYRAMAKRSTRTTPGTSRPNWRGP
jgi:hypothetical protein